MGFKCPLVFSYMKQPNQKKTAVTTVLYLIFSLIVLTGGNTEEIFIDTLFTAAMSTNTAAPVKTGSGQTLTITEGNLSLDFDSAGMIRRITLEGSDGGAVFQRAALGQSILANTTTKSIDLQNLAEGLRVVRVIEDTQGRQATVTETFSPGLEANSVTWEVVIESGKEPWSTPIQTCLQISPDDGDLEFWTAGTRTGLPQFNGYPDPLRAMPFTKLHLRFGGEGISATVNEGFSVPIASWFHHSSDRAISLVQSPLNFVQEMHLHTDTIGRVTFERTHLRIGGGNTIQIHMQLVAHEADWRAGLGFMTRQYPSAFDPHNPTVHAIGGGGTYADYRGETLDAAHYKHMGLTMNWNARFPWPYLGMSLPPVQSATEEWMSFGWQSAKGQRDSNAQSVQLMNGVARLLREQGFHQLEYFTVTEAGTSIMDPAPPRKAADDAELWKDPNDFVHYQIPNANLGISSWEECRVVDPGDPDWQAEVLRQITDISNRLSYSSGIVIDRLDWLAKYNPNADDGITWNGGVKRSLIYSWHEVMDKLIPITRARNKVVFINSHIMRRIDVLRHSDGIYSEQRGTGIHHLLAFAGVRKPVVIWRSPGVSYTQFEEGNYHTEFQEGLYLGFFHSVPFPGADHNTQPNASLEKWFLDYGPLYNSMKGRKWVLQPHIIKVTSSNALANVFEVESGFVVPVVFGGSSTYATVELGALSIGKLHSIEVLHPGIAAATILTPTLKDKRIVIEVPLVHGCAMVRIISTEAVAQDNGLFR